MTVTSVKLFLPVVEKNVGLGAIFHGEYDAKPV